MTPADLAQVILAANRDMPFAEQMHSVEALAYADAVLAHLHPTITTAEELEALPVWSIVLDKWGHAWQKTDVNFWQCFGDYWDDHGLALIGPVTLLRKGTP